MLFLRSKGLLALFIILSVTGCSNHDFVGKYEIRSNITDALGSLIDGFDVELNQVEIGTNYIDWGDGQQLYEEVYVEKGKYSSELVFKKADEEIRFRIVDENTLELGKALKGVVAIRLHRITQ